MRYYQLTIIGQEAPQLPIQPIKEQRGPNFVSLEFYTEPEKIPALEKELKARSLRYMLLVKKLPPAKPAKSARSAKLPKPSLARRVKTKEKKVDLKEIDKKIEEVLKE